MKTYDHDAIPGTGADDAAAHEDDNLDPSPIHMEEKLFKQQLDTEFPLSGGETDEELDESLEALKEDIAGKDLKKHLDTDFPLSGGETDQDLF